MDDAAPTDPLSDVLRLVRVEGALFSRAACARPWGVSTRGASGGIFHVVLRGQGLATALDSEGHALSSASFGAGDLLVLPHGHAHLLVDAPGSAATWIRDLPVAPGEDGLPVVRAGMGEPFDTELLCGTLRFGEEGRALLLPHLPPLLHTPAQGALGGWLDATVRQLADEVRRREPGGELVIARLAEILFVQAVRAWTRRPTGVGPGWVQALGDPALARALALLHGAPAHPWSVEDLARRAGLSRSVFYDRFTERVGEPPAAYLLRWRMTVARQALRDPRLPIALVAQRVGYGSEAAFNRAFKRAVGVPPAAWRRGAQAAPPD